jgi:hypothetical protein
MSEDLFYQIWGIGTLFLIALGAVVSVYDKNFIWVFLAIFLGAWWPFLLAAMICTWVIFSTILSKHANII